MGGVRRGQATEVGGGASAAAEPALAVSGGLVRLAALDGQLGGVLRVHGTDPSEERFVDAFQDVPLR